MDKLACFVFPCIILYVNITFPQCWLLLSSIRSATGDLVRFALLHLLHCLLSKSASVAGSAYTEIRMLASAKSVKLQAFFSQYKKPICQVRIAKIGARMVESSMDAAAVWERGMMWVTCNLCCQLLLCFCWWEVGREVCKWWSHDHGTLQSL